MAMSYRHHLLDALDDLLGLLVVVPEPLARHQHFDLAQAAHQR